MSIFRETTKHAIAEIICENAEAGRFGIAMTQHDLDVACNSIVDLFEMTLELRRRASMGAPNEPTPAPTPTLARRVSAAKLDNQQDAPINASLALNRTQRVPLSDTEISRLRAVR